MAVRLVMLIAVMMLAAACSDSSSTTSTTTTPDSDTTAATAPASGTGSTPTTTEPAAGGTDTTAATTTTAPEFSLPEFSIIERTDDNVLVVAVPPGTYSDIDLQNLVGEVVERFAPVNGLHIVDDESIVDLVLADSVSDADQAFLDEHYFLRLEDGFRMVFLGPFSDVEDVILGS